MCVSVSYMSSGASPGSFYWGKGQTAGGDEQGIRGWGDGRRILNMLAVFKKTNGHALHEHNAKKLRRVPKFSGGTSP